MKKLMIVAMFVAGNAFGMETNDNDQEQGQQQQNPDQEVKKSIVNDLKTIDKQLDNFLDEIKAKNNGELPQVAVSEEVFTLGVFEKLSVMKSRNSSGSIDPMFTDIVLHLDSLKHDFKPRYKFMIQDLVESSVND